MNGYCPLDSSSTKFSTIYTVLKHTQAIRDIMGQEDTVITFWLAIHVKAKQIHKCIKCLKNWESKCAIRKLKHYYLPFIETSGEVFYSKFLCQNFNLELRGSLTEKFNTPVRIVVIISRVKMVNLIFIIFAIMLCNFELIRTINSIIPLFVRIFCNAFFDWHPVSRCISFISFGVSFPYLLRDGPEHICKEKYAMLSFNRPECRAQYYDKDIFKAWYGKLKYFR